MLIASGTYCKKLGDSRYIPEIGHAKVGEFASGILLTGEEKRVRVSPSPEHSPPGISQPPSPCSEALCPSLKPCLRPWRCVRYHSLLRVIRRITRTKLWIRL